MQAYFDESGTHAGARYTCVAGYVMEADQAICLEREWRLLLEEYNLKQFHMGDCAGGYDDFEGRSEGERDEIERRVMGIIERRVNCGICVSAREEHVKRYFLSGAYFLCAVWCFAGIQGWAKKAGLCGNVECFFEKGHRDERYVNEQFSKIAMSDELRASLRYHSHTFASKRVVPVLQAADVLAWQSTRYLGDKFPATGKSRRKVRRTFQDLVRKATHYAFHFTPDHLDAFFGRHEFADWSRRFTMLDLG